MLLQHSLSTCYLWPIWLPHSVKRSIQSRLYCMENFKNRFCHAPGRSLLKLSGLHPTSVNFQILLPNCSFTKAISYAILFLLVMKFRATTIPKFHISFSILRYQSKELVPSSSTFIFVLYAEFLLLLLLS